MTDWGQLQRKFAAQSTPALPSSRRLRQLILWAIQEGALPPGSRLKEVELVKALEVSRTPLREALTALRAEQILEMDDDGLRVRKLEWRDVTSLYALRGQLEAMAAALATTHATSSEKQVIADICTEEVRLMSVGAAPALLATHNKRFHNAILQAAGNRFLSESLHHLSRLMVLLGHTAYALPERSHAIQKEHQEINQAIQRGHAQQAETAMKHHLDQALKARLHLLSLTEEDEMD